MIFYLKIKTFSLFSLHKTCLNFDGLKFGMLTKNKIPLSVYITVRKQGVNEMLMRIILFSDTSDLLESVKRLSKVQFENSDGQVFFFNRNMVFLKSEKD